MDGKAVLAEAVRASQALLKSERDEMAVPSYTHWNPLIQWLFFKRLRTAARLGELSSSDSVLDAGCGSGLLLVLISPRVKKAVGIDLHEKVAKAVVAKAGARNVTVRRGGVEKIPFAAGSFDTVFCLDVLEHVQDPSAAVVEIRRVLRPGGRAVVSVPTENWLYKLGRMIAGFKGDYHRRGAADIERAFGKGFAIRRKVFLPVVFLPLFELFVAEKK